MAQSSSWSRCLSFIRSVQCSRECSKHVQIFPRSSDEISSFRHRSRRRTLAKWYTWKNEQKNICTSANKDLHSIPIDGVHQQKTLFLTFLKNSARDPVRRGLLAARGCASELVAGAAVRLGEAVSKTWAVRGFISLAWSWMTVMPPASFFITKRCKTPAHQQQNQTNIFFGKCFACLTRDKKKKTWQVLGRGIVSCWPFTVAMERTVAVAVVFWLFSMVLGMILMGVTDILFTGDCGGGSSPNKRLLALPAAGEL